ncbi:hypothetical protein mRhiFer1_009753 [Rhinolophus ferrumequinum]|uniref:Uncharacterized protein n=1 Tax=Rhinolophus ferrumequinum TaxID=59479 RepID=A0A7J7ZD10_RHIFE|nr:hypothetical protein mRhiFer1_009753 [Rhinolophus ferrumequinum]
MTATAKVDGKTSTSWLGPTPGPQDKTVQESAARWGGVGRKPGRAHGQGVSDWLFFCVNTRDRSYKDRSGVFTWETGPSLAQYLPGFSSPAGGGGGVGDPGCGGSCDPGLEEAKGGRAALRGEYPPGSKRVQPLLESPARPRPRRCTSDPSWLGLQPRVRSASAHAPRPLAQ